MNDVLANKREISQSMDSFLQDDWSSLRWTPFVSFNATRQQMTQIPNLPGVYRVKVSGDNRLAYIGQTGRDLRWRTRMLMRNTLAAEMPFNDPHTAAPRLWSFRVSENLQFEVSAAAVTLPKPRRMGLECCLLWRYRTEAKCSPLCNFGRLHPLYRTSRNRKTGDRGGLLPNATNNDFGKSLAALIEHGKPIASDWMQLEWTDWQRLREEAIAHIPSGPGLYRIATASALVYLGQSNDLSKRLRSHCRTQWGEEAVRVSCVQMPSTITSNQMLELENDLIGAFYRSSSNVPAYQFRLGRPCDDGSSENQS